MLIYVDMLSHLKWKLYPNGYNEERMLHNANHGDITRPMLVLIGTGSERWSLGEGVLLAVSTDAGTPFTATDTYEYDGEIQLCVIPDRRMLSGASLY
jgi:hypothetical protein